MTDTGTDSVVDIDDNLSVIAQYLYTSNNISLAEQVLKSPKFNPYHKNYLLDKRELKENLYDSESLNLISNDNIDYVFDILIKYNPSIDKNKIFNQLLSFAVLELSLIVNDKISALNLFRKYDSDDNNTSYKFKIDPRNRENLSSVLINLNKSYLNSINWIDIKTIKQSRNLLVDHLFNVLTNFKILSFNKLISNNLNYEKLILNNLNYEKLPINKKKILNFHSNEVWCLKYSPNGKYLATGSKDCKIIIYDILNNYSILNILNNHSESIIFINWSFDSSKILSISFDQSMKIFDLNLKKNIYETDNKNLNFFTKSRFSCASFLPDFNSSNNILISSNDGKLFIFNIESNQIVNQYLTIQITDLIIFNDKIYSISLSNDLIILNLSNLKLIKKINIPDQPVSIQKADKYFKNLNNKGNEYLLLNTKSNGLILVNISGLNNDPDYPFVDLTLSIPESNLGIDTNSNNTNYILRGCAGNGLVISGFNKNGDVWLWSGYNGNVLHRIHDHTGLVNCVDWRPSLSSSDQSCILQEGKKNQETTANANSNANTGYPTDGPMLEWASASDDGQVFVYGI